MGETPRTNNEEPFERVVSGDRLEASTGYFPDVRMADRAWDDVIRSLRKVPTALAMRRADQIEGQVQRSRWERQMRETHDYRLVSGAGWCWVPKAQASGGGSGETEQ